jgi:hypothetical protein
MLFFFLAVAITIFLIALWQHKNPVKAIVELVNGVVPEEPQALADAAGVDLETYTLARIAQSEEGLSNERAKIAVMYAALNHSQRTGKSITELATKGNPKRSDFDAANGRYGRQGIHPYCTTIAAPTLRTIELAKSVSDGSAIDETDGAQWWDNPHTQDVLHLANPKDPITGKGYYSSAEIAERRTSKGARLVIIDGVGTRFWA